MKYMYKPVDGSLFWRQAETDIVYTWGYKYKERCRSEVLGNAYRITESCTNLYDISLYSGGRALAKYQVHSEYSISISGCSDTRSGTYNTVLKDIKYGY